MKKGLDLYYGYKLDEKTMISVFFDSNFRKYIEDIYATKPELKPIFDEDDKVEQIDPFIKELFLMYHDKYFFSDNGSPSKIRTCCTKCCMYDDDSDWIIGIKMCHLPAFKNKINRVDAHLITDQDTVELNKINKKFNLHIDRPSFYSVPSDCWSCT